MLDHVIGQGVDDDAVLALAVPGVGSQTVLRRPGAIGGQRLGNGVVGTLHILVLVLPRSELEGNLSGRKILQIVLQVETLDELGGGIGNQDAMIAVQVAVELGQLDAVHHGRFDEHLRLEGVLAHVDDEVVGADRGALELDLQGDGVILVGLGGEGLQVHLDEVAVILGGLHLEEAGAGAGLRLTRVRDVEGRLGGVEGRRGEEIDHGALFPEEDDLVGVFRNIDDGVDGRGGNLRDGVGGAVHRDDERIGRLLDGNGGAATALGVDDDGLAVAQDDGPHAVGLVGAGDGEARHDRVLEVLLGLVPGTFQDFYPTGKVVKPLVVAGDEGGNDHGSDEERADEVFFHVEKGLCDWFVVVLLAQCPVTNMRAYP